MTAAHQDRAYFTPTEVPDELSRATRRCVPACCAFLGHPSPRNGTPAWFNILQSISPEGCVIRSFNNVNDIGQHLDNLFVATMNQKGGVAGAGHSVVLYRSEDQMGSTKCRIYNPGERSTTATVDLSRERDTEGWNYICAAFIPGTNIQTNETEIVSVMDSSDDDDHGCLGQSPIARSAGGAAASRSSSSRVNFPSSSQNGSAQRAHSHHKPSPRRTPTRAAKKINSMPSLFYKEVLKALDTRQGYSRVMQYNSSHQKLPEDCTKEVIGQHVAKHLQGLGWVIWFHYDSSQFIIAKTKAFFGYNIEAAEEGKDRFIGYAAFAEWAFKEGIYEESLENADGKAFLDGVGLENDPYKLFESTNTSSVANPRSAKKRKHSADGTTTTTTQKKKTKKKKKKRRDDAALGEQLA